MSSRSYSQGGGGATEFNNFLPRTILGFKTPETEAFHEYLINLAKKTDIYKHKLMYTGFPEQFITKMKQAIIKQKLEITMSPVTLENYKSLKRLRLHTDTSPPGFIYLGPLDEPGSPNVYTWFYQCGLGYTVLLKTPYKYDNFKFANVDTNEGMQIPSSVIKSVGSQRREDNKSISTNKTSSRMSTSSSGDVSHSRKQKSSSRQDKTSLIIFELVMYVLRNKN